MTGTITITSTSVRLVTSSKWGKIPKRLQFFKIYLKWIHAEQIYHLYIQRCISWVFRGIAFSIKFRQHTSILILLFIWFFWMSYFSFVVCLPSNVAVDISQNWCDFIEWHCTVPMGRLPNGTWNGIDFLRQIFEYKYASSCHHCFGWIVNFPRPIPICCFKAQTSKPDKCQQFKQVLLVSDLVYFCQASIQLQLLIS